MYRGASNRRGGSSNFRGRGRGRGGGGSNTKQSTQPQGLFADGIWQCNCTPRLPAEHFRVKKENENHGRWFYTCQKSERKCGFFLWDDDAKVREEGAVLGGRRSEAGVQEGWNAGRERVNNPSALPTGKGLFEQRAGGAEDDSTTNSSPSPRQTPGVNGVKRSAGTANLDPWDMESEDEDALAKAADAAGLATPHKAQRTGVYATPATTTKRKLPWLDGSPGPQSTIKSEPDFLDTPSKQPGTFSTAESHTLRPETPTHAPTPGTAATPSPLTRHKDALTNPADDASSLTSEVMSTLSTLRIPNETLSTLRTILTRHDLRNQGIKKGRDISRLALKAKDAKIAELQARIASLEADRDVERWLGKTKKWDSAQGATWES